MNHLIDPFYNGVIVGKVQVLLLTLTIGLLLECTRTGLHMQCVYQVTKSLVTTS